MMHEHERTSLPLPIDGKGAVPLGQGALAILFPQLIKLPAERPKLMTKPVPFFGPCLQFVWIDGLVGTGRQIPRVADVLVAATISPQRVVMAGNAGRYVHLSALDGVRQFDELFTGKRPQLEQSDRCFDCLDAIGWPQSNSVRQCTDRGA